MFVLILPSSSVMWVNESISCCRNVSCCSISSSSLASLSAWNNSATESGLYTFGNENGIPSLVIVVFIPVLLNFCSAYASVFLTLFIFPSFMRLSVVYPKSLVQNSW